MKHRPSTERCTVQSTAPINCRSAHPREREAPGTLFQGHLCKDRPAFLFSPDDTRRSVSEAVVAAAAAADVAVAAVGALSPRAVHVNDSSVRSLRCGYMLPRCDQPQTIEVDQQPPTE